MNGSHRRDVVCIGVGDGRVLPLAELVAQLPADLPAAVFIVTAGCSAGALLPTLLGRHAALPVAAATDDEPISCRRVRVGPCDRQLRLTRTATDLSPCGVEHRARPTIDAFFSSAASSFGRRVIGILLGAEDEHASAAARAVHNGGGVIIESAAGLGRQPPESARPDCHSDFVVPIEDMAELLVRLTAPPSTASGSFPRLDIEALECTNLVVVADRVPVIELLVEAVASAEATARRRAVRLRCVWEREVTVVLADRRRLRRTLTHLLTDAIERTPRGGAVLLSAELGAGEVRFCIADTGPAATLEEREHSLDDDESCSFVADDTELDPASAVRSFVEEQGGRIWIDSDPAAGTAFYFSLPSLPCVIAHGDPLGAC